MKNCPYVKVRFILVCLMEQQLIEKQKTITQQSEAFFYSNTYINMGETDVKEILDKSIYDMLTQMSKYQRNGILRRLLN